MNLPSTGAVPASQAAARFTKLRASGHGPTVEHGAAGQRSAHQPATRVTVAQPRIPLRGRLLLLGCGSVSRCLQPLLLRHLDMDLAKLTVLDFDDRATPDADLMEAGASFVRHRITPENLDATLRGRLGPGDLLVNLTWDIDTGDLIQWCQDHGVLYVDTSVELWDNTFADHAATDPTDRTLYVRHMDLRRRAAA